MTRICFPNMPTKTIWCRAAIIQPNGSPHLLKASLAQNLPFLQRLIPFGDVLDSEIQTAIRGGIELGRDPFLIFQCAIFQSVAGGPVRDYVGFTDYAGMTHAERSEHVLLQQIAIKLAGYFLDENSERDVTEIAVTPLLSRSEAKRLRRDHLQQLILGVVLLQREFFRVIAQPGRVGE